jgi:hypothetical protein
VALVAPLLVEVVEVAEVFLKEHSLYLLFLHRHTQLPLDRLVPHPVWARLLVQRLDLMELLAQLEVGAMAA